MHVLTWHSTVWHSSAGSQLFGSWLHPSQSPLMQASLPVVPPAVPSGAGLTCFTPAMHISTLQGSLSCTRSVSSGRTAGVEQLGPASVMPLPAPALELDPTGPALASSPSVVSPQPV